MVKTSHFKPIKNNIPEPNLGEHQEGIQKAAVTDGEVLGNIEEGVVTSSSLDTFESCGKLTFANRKYHRCMDDDLCKECTANHDKAKEGKR